MNIREFVSVDLKDRQNVYYHFSEFPVRLLDWIEHQYEEIIIVWNEKGKICFVSKSAKFLLDSEPEDLLGCDWFNLFDPITVTKIERYLNEESCLSEAMNLDIAKYSKIFHVELSIDRVEDDVNEMTYYVSCLKDITAQKEAKEMMIQAEKMSVVGQLAAGIAHEIRNPLTSLKGFLQLLQAGVRHKDEYYKIMKDEIEKMEAITSELLFMAKPLTNNMKDECVDKMIRDVAILLQSQARLKNVSIKIREPITEKIYCDSSQIKQVLINLVKNAIEAMEQPGEITLFVHSNNEQVIINIKDEGVGIPTDIIDQLGSPFFTTKKEGTGLGLNITKEILKLHGGSLSFSKNRDKGSTFQLFFPNKLKQTNGL
ncbi:ATP-binding protein [Oceanobacillus sp. FSL H7-0719]|uniref:ATP-binding protein n=1 Tax=Oceanobacillus sp. FSL H7-0719 TaxID=2954507 RepID=UPI003248877D